MQYFTSQRGRSLAEHMGTEKEARQVQRRPTEAGRLEVSRHQLGDSLEGAGLQRATVAEPGRVHPSVVRAGAQPQPKRRAGCPARSVAARRNPAGRAAST